MLIGVPFMVLLLRFRPPSYSWAATDAVLESARPWLPWLAAGLVIGVGLGSLIFAETIYSIGWETDYGGARFFCDVVAGRRRLLELRS